jgi:UDP-glucuronate 4-epimerase
MIKEKIFITGHLGFIGSRLTKELDKLNIDWLGYDLRSGDDIRDEFNLSKALNEYNPDIIIHLAARAGAELGEKYYKEYISTNITGTKNIVAIAEQMNIDKIISFSSSSVLGGNKVCSPGDNELSPLTEDSPYAPTNMYGYTKMIGEYIVKQSSIKNRFIVRPFSVYGENGRNDMVLFKWINNIKSGKPCIRYSNKGSSLRGYTYVADVVDGVIKIILNKDADPDKHHIVHLGGNEVISTGELWGIVGCIADDKGIDAECSIVPSKGWDIQYSFSDCSYAKSLLDWEPKTRFNEKVTEIVSEELSKIC